MVTHAMFLKALIWGVRSKGSPNICSGQIHGVYDGTFCVDLKRQADQNHYKYV